MPESLENLTASIGGFQQETSIQAETASSLDAKLLGLLAFMSAAAGLLLTLEEGLESYRWLLLVGAAGGIFWTLIGLIGGKDVEAGPDPVDFYAKYAEAEPLDFSKQLHVDFRPVLSENKERIKARDEMLSLAFAWAVIFSVVFGLARALVAIL